MLSMNAAMLRIGYDLGNNMAAALLAATAACGALTGACFSAFGVESMTSMVAGFSRPGIPMCIVVLGLGALYVSGVAAAGAVNCSPAYVRNVGWAALAVVLGEVLVLVAAAQDPLATAREHEDAWRRIHSVNPLSLQRIEHAFGCCGFQDHTDMPSHPGCAREAAVDGCASHLARAAFRVSRSTLRWCSAVLITQLLLLVAGGFLVGRVHEASGAWLVDDGEGVEGEEEGAAELSATTPVAAATAPTAEAPAHQNPLPPEEASTAPAAAGGGGPEADR